MLEEVWEAVERVGVDASTALSRLGFSMTSRLGVDDLGTISSSRANLMVFFGVGVVGSSSRAKRTVFLRVVMSDILAV